jgi:hypothetical protein
LRYPVLLPSFTWPENQTYDVYVSERSGEEREERGGEGGGREGTGRERTRGRAGGGVGRGREKGHKDVDVKAQMLGSRLLSLGRRF